MTNTSTSRRHALFVIEDDEAMRSALGSLLRAWEIPTHSFSSAEAFLESYDDDWKGCLLIDVRMPGMDGKELLEELRRNNFTLTAILMTGHGDVDVLRQSLTDASTVILEKPFRADALKHVLKQLLPEYFC